MDTRTVERNHADHERRLVDVERMLTKLPLRIPTGGGGSSSAFEFVTADTWPDLEDLPQTGQAIKIGYTTEDRYFGVWVVNRWMCLTHFLTILEP